MWTISYFQDSGNNKSLSEFSGGGAGGNTFLDGHLQQQNAFLAKSWVLGLGVAFGKYSKSENRLTIKMPLQPKPERQPPDSVMCSDCTVC